MKVGHYFALVVVVLWLLSGIAFPLWIDMAVRTDDAAHLRVIQPEGYAHFLLSQSLCGAISATLTFFLVTYVSVRCLYPRLLPFDARESGAGDDLFRLERRVISYFIVALMAPAVAILALSLIESALKTVFGVLAVLGLLCSLLAFKLGQVIVADSKALALAVNPAEELIKRRSEGLEALLSSSRR